WRRKYMALVRSSARATKARRITVQYSPLVFCLCALAFGGPAIAQQPLKNGAQVTLHNVQVHSPPAMLMPSSTSRPNGDVPLLYIAFNARIGHYKIEQAVLGIGENPGQKQSRQLGKSAGPLSGRCQTVTIHAV